PHQLVDLLAVKPDDVRQKLVESCVSVTGELRGPEIGVEAGAGQRHLGDAAGPCTQVGELLSRQVPPRTQLSDDSEAFGPCNGLVAQRLAVPVSPQKGVEIDLAEPLESFRQLALEGHAAHLSVGDDV